MKKCRAKSQVANVEAIKARSLWSVVGYAGAELIAAERLRQISAEGWTPEHDDKHRGKQLAKAASSYLATHAEPDVDHARSPHLNAPCWNWPWDKKWWKPSKDPVRNLAKAGALIAAEIDRLLRAEKTRSPNNLDEPRA